MSQYGSVLQGGSCNGTSMNSTISITDTEVDLLIRTFKVRVSESVGIVRHVRGVPVTVLVRILEPQCKRITRFLVIGIWYQPFMILLNFI